MTDKFMPKVGDIISIKDKRTERWHDCHVLYVDLQVIVFRRKDFTQVQHRDVSDVDMRPIQSEDDKKRDEQIERLAVAIGKIGLQGFDEPRKFAAPMLHEQGVRVIAKGQYVVKALTDEQLKTIEHICAKWVGCPSYFINGFGEHLWTHLKRELGIEEK